MWSVQGSSLSSGLWLCCSLTVLISFSTAVDTYNSDAVRDAAEASLRKPLMRHEKPDDEDDDLGWQLGGQSVGTSENNEAVAKEPHPKPVLKKSFGSKKKAAKAAGMNATKIADEVPDNPKLNQNAFWKRRLEVIRRAESKIPGEDLHPGEMDIIDLLDAVAPKKERSRALASLGRDRQATSGKSTHDLVVPLMEELGYRGLVLRTLKAPVEKSDLEDQLRKANRSGRIYITYQEHVSPDGAADLMRTAEVPHDLDVLKVDVDSYDMDLLKGILKQGFDPKIIVMEMNADLAPPIHWYLKYHSNFVFKDKAASKGMYGASPDAVYEELSVNQKYSLVGIDMKDGRHDLWFVKNSLVRVPSQANQPLLSWRGMVRMFWSQQVNRKCNSISHKVYSCPLGFLREVYKEAHGVMPSNFSRDSWDQMADISIYLADPNFQKKDAPYGYTTLLNTALRGLCGSKNRDYCPTDFKVTKDPSKDNDMHDEEDEDDPDSLVAMKATRHSH